MKHANLTPMKRCAYCVRAAGLTTDHVFPSSWYPNTTPMQVQRWTVPSCEPCNNHWSRIEEDVGLRLAASVEPDREASAGVWANYLKSVSPSMAPNPKEASIRALRLRNVLDGFKSADSVPSTAVLPHSRINQVEGAGAIVVDAKEFNGLIAKFVRGAHCYLEKRPLPTPAKIEINHISPKALLALMEFDRHAMKFRLGPGIWLSRLHARNSVRYTAIYIFCFWQRALFLGHVDLKGRALRHL